ncbi:MAG: fluoride efflux transporter CrcB [Alphaproteobacteria bacterium]
MNLTLAIFAGGGIGAVLRHFFIVAETRLIGASFSYATFAVNVIGCFLVGALIEWLAMKADVSLAMRAFLTTGILGGFTTFSAFSVEVLKLAETGHPAAAAAYAALSVICSVAAVFGGVYLMRGVLS